MQARRPKKFGQETSTNSQNDARSADAAPIKAKQKGEKRSASPDENIDPKNIPKKKRGFLDVIRSSTAATVINPTTSESEDLKTAMLVSSQQVDTESQLDQMVSPLRKAVSTIPTNRTIAEVSKYSEFGSPIEVITAEKGTVLRRDYKNGVFNIFSNRVVQDDETINTKLSLLSHDDPLFKSKAYLATRSGEGTEKSMDVVITADELAKYRGKKRQISQGRVMASEGSSYTSANTYAAASKAFENAKAEWLHLIAHQFLGPDAQDQKNMVVGTAYANTSMMYVESLVKTFSEHFPAVLVRVNATLKEGTQYADKITYSVITDSFKMNFIFNANTPNQPHIIYKDYIEAFGAVLIQQATQKVSSESDNSSAAAPSVTRRQNFFMEKLQRASEVRTPSSDGEETKTPASQHLHNTLQSLIKKP